MNSGPECFGWVLPWCCEKIMFEGEVNKHSGPQVLTKRKTPRKSNWADPESALKYTTRPETSSPTVQYSLWVRVRIGSSANNVLSAPIQFGPDNQGSDVTYSILYCFPDKTPNAMTKRVRQLFRIIEAGKFKYLSAKFVAPMLAARRRERSRYHMHEGLGLTLAPPNLSSFSLNTLPSLSFRSLRLNCCTACKAWDQSAWPANWSEDVKRASSLLLKTETMTSCCKEWWKEWGRFSHWRTVNAGKFSKCNNMSASTLSVL